MPTAIEPNETIARYVPALKGRIASLDGLRAFSILLVLLGHTAYSDGSPRLIAPFQHVGNIGVRFFFVISGFLITTLLLKEWSKSGSISLRSFYLRRVLRIFPAVYVLIGVIAILGAYGFIHLKAHEVLYASTFLMNYHDYKNFWLGQLWSLSVEEQFYLIWPGLLVLAGVRRSFRVAWIIVIVAPLLRAFLWFGLHASETVMTKHFETVMDALAIGCLLAAYFNRLGESRIYKRLQSHGVLFVGAGLGIVAIANALFLVSLSGFYIWGQSLANIGTAMCIDWAIRNPTHPFGRLLNWKPIAAIGIGSYSLYLWQNPFLLGDAGSIVNRYPLNLLCTAVMALFSYFLVEKPFLSIKTLIEKRTPGLR
jgi:peptidoglycan/LPS O-acetylase OafA/YrhL